LHKDRDAFLTDYKEAIRAVGPEHCILSEELTFHSSEFDEHLDGVAPFVARLGLNEHEVDLMLKQNPARLLGLTARASAQSATAAATQAPGAAPASAESPTLDFEFFKTRVEPIFLKRRAGHARCYACHASGTGPQYLVKMLPGSTFWTEDQSRKNFESVSKLVNSDDPMNSRFLIHPLSPLVGGDITFVHGGGRQFESKEDPDWQTMAEWVSGRKVASSPRP
jgi:hypothetical protein